MPSSQHRQQTTDQTAGFLERVRQLLELIRFSHTVFALPFALLAAVLAWRDPTNGFAWHQLAGIVLAMVTARSAAMAFNRLVDRHHDAENPRTARRQLPTGELGVTLTWCFTLVCSAGSLLRPCCFCWVNHPIPGRSG